MPERRYTELKKSFASACREKYRRFQVTRFASHVRHSLADGGVDVVKIKESMGHASIVIASDQGKRGAIVMLSEYRQHCRKFVTGKHVSRFNPL